MDQILPPYIFYCGIAGLILLILCFICWGIFYFAYDVNIYSSTDKPTPIPYGWEASGVSALVFGIFGVILSCFTLYGHYLLDKDDGGPNRIFSDVVQSKDVPNIIPLRWQK